MQTIDLPLRFFLTMLMMIAATMPISTVQIIIVQMLLISQVNILFHLDFLSQLVRFLVWLEEHKQHKRDQQYRDDQADDVQVACERAADLVDTEGDNIGKAALVSDREERPFCGVHLAFDRAHRRKAGSAEQVEYEEGEARYRCKYLRKRRPCAEFSAAVQNAHCADDVFLRDKSCDRSDSRLPVAPAERSEDPSDSVSESCEHTIADLILGEHCKCAVDPTEAAQEPEHDSRKQDDRARLFDERPAALPH